MDEAATLALRYSRPKLIGMLVFWFVALLLGGLVVTGRFGYLASGSWKEFVLWLALPVFAGMLLYNLYRLFQAHDIVIIGPEGILDSRLSAMRMPWHQMEEVSQVNIVNNRFCRLDLLAEFDAVLPPSAMLKFRRWLNKAGDETGLKIHVQGLYGSFDVFWQAIVRNCPPDKLHH